LIPTWLEWIESKGIDHDTAGRVLSLVKKAGQAAGEIEIRGGNRKQTNKMLVCDFGVNKKESSDKCKVHVLLPKSFARPCKTFPALYDKLATSR